MGAQSIPPENPAKSLCFPSPPVQQCRTKTRSSPTSSCFFVAAALRKLDLCGLGDALNKGSDVWHFFSSESISRHPGTHQCLDQCLSQLAEHNCKPASQNSPKKKVGARAFGGSAQTMKAEGGQPEVHMRAPGGPTPLLCFFSTHLREGEATPQDIC